MPAVMNEFQATLKMMRGTPVDSVETLAFIAEEVLEGVLHGAKMKAFGPAVSFDPQTSTIEVLCTVRAEDEDELGETCDFILRVASRAARDAEDELDRGPGGLAGAKSPSSLYLSWPNASRDVIPALA